MNIAFSIEFRNFGLKHKSNFYVSLANQAGWLLKMWAASRVTIQLYCTGNFNWNSIERYLIQQKYTIGEEVRGATYF
jgi:hypothetical protein